MKPSWEETGFVPNQYTPSLDDKANDSPPIVSTEAYHRDCDNGFVRIGHATYGQRKGKADE